MLKEGIIEESSNPWMAPEVYTRKKNGDIRLCVDYHELNKRTVKDAYSLLRPDEVQDQLAGSTLFSTLDLQSGYWQLLVHPEDQPRQSFPLGLECSAKCHSGSQGQSLPRSALNYHVSG